MVVTVMNDWLTFDLSSEKWPSVNVRSGVQMHDHHLSLIFQVCTAVVVQLSSESSHFCFPPVNWISIVCARAGKGDGWYLMIVTCKCSIWYKLGEAEKLIEDPFLWSLLGVGGCLRRVHYSWKMTWLKATRSPVCDRRRRNLITSASVVY